MADMSFRYSSLAILLLLSVSGTEGKDPDPYPDTPANYDAPWPERVRIKPNLKIEVAPEEGDHYIYETDHYRFRCDVPLSEKIVQKAALSL